MPGLGSINQYFILAAIDLHRYLSHRLAADRIGSNSSLSLFLWRFDCQSSRHHCIFIISFFLTPPTLILLGQNVSRLIINSVLGNSFWAGQSGIVARAKLTLIGCLKIEYVPLLSYDPQLK